MQASTRGLVPRSGSAFYQGTTVDVDEQRGFVLLKLADFRSNVRARDAFDFFLEIYEDQPLRRVIIDMREAYWPLETSVLRERFLEHARRVPRSRVAVLCQEPEHEVMIAHREGNIEAGHEVLYTRDEAEALAFVRR